MQQSWKDRARELLARLETVLDGGTRMLAWAIVSLLLLVVISAWMNPAKFGSYLWIVSKLSLAAVLGYAFDRAASHDSQPTHLEGIERAMAYGRRATMMAASIIAAGLMP